MILFLAWLASACQSGATGATDEDCEAVGDEDDNGLADCDDPTCAGAPACQPRCGNGKREAGEGCDDGNTTSGDGCDNNCMVTSCGNGIVTRGEACDDGNTTSGDGCDNNCQATGCGNGVVTPGEACDDGNTSGDDACTSACKLARCGDGFLRAGVEQCDDGNTSGDDACTSACKLARCGDGFLRAGVEQCDDGNTSGTDACTSACEPAQCGDGFVRTGVEACDDGNTSDTDACTSACVPARCGDGFVWTGMEQCDDRNTSNTDACTNACVPARCGDGFIQAGMEQCDDRNTSNTDACTNACVPARCGDGFVWTGMEQCDDHNTSDTDACTNTCEPARCGDGFVWTGMEQCDDGNTSNTDACINTCERAVCGDGFIQVDVEQCDAGNTGNVPGCDTTCIADVLAYIKASNTEGGQFIGDSFGSVALSADGSTLAVGASVEASAATGIDGDQTDNSARFAGAVYVFTRNGTTWSQQAYIKASNTSTFDQFGFSVALSADGSTLAVGATGEGSGAIGIDGDQTDNSAAGSGAVYVFTRSGTTWSQQAYIKASNTNQDEPTGDDPVPQLISDDFGSSVALSADGSTLAVGARNEDSAATVINGDQANNFARSAGAVYVFTRTGTTWSQQAYVKASNTGRLDQFGGSVALSANGAILAVGAISEGSAAIGINGNQADNSAGFAGAVYVFTRNGTTWSQQAYVKASNTGASDQFGGSVALSADGATLAVGARNEDSAATGIGGDQANNSASSAGAVYVFTHSGTTWSQQAYIKASNTGAGDGFGGSVALSANGATLAVGAGGEASAATGIGGDRADNSASGAGAIYVFTRSGTTWNQPAYVKASNTGAGDGFGGSVALSADGATLAVGAIREDSAATGIDGDQVDNSAPGAGAVYVYH